MHVQDSTGPARLALVGAGQRGADVYGSYVLAHPDLARFVAVADPEPMRRLVFAQAHAIHEAAAFADWRDLLAAEIPVEGLVIASPDRMHAEPAIAALKCGHAVLLEKPIAPSPEGVAAVASAASRTGGELTVAHPLRYTPFFTRIGALVADGIIGELVEIDHLENVGWWHFVHSFVRGNWRRQEVASPLILAKACHDLDIIRWLVGAPCTAVSSFGSLRHFRLEAAPPGAPDYCIDGCPSAEVCPFYAPRFYENVPRAADWPIPVLLREARSDSLADALRRGPYGRCVYHCDNDVADHQATLLEFASGTVATLTVTAFTAENTRTIKLMGTRGEIRGHMERGEIEVRRFIDGKGMEVPSALRMDVPRENGHGGGDPRMIDAFVRRVIDARDGRPSGESPTSLAVSLESHHMAFAAERARSERSVVTL